MIDTPAVPNAEIAESSTRWFWSGLVIVLAVSISIAAWKAPTSNEGLTATAALALISGTAVAIERAMEAFWSAIDGSARTGGWWPLTKVSDRILAIEGPTNSLILEPMAGIESALVATRARLNDADDLARRIDAQLDVLNREVPRLASKVDNAATLAPGSPRLQIVHDAKTQAVAVYMRAAALVDEGTEDAVATIDQYAGQIERLEDIIASFSDNPARKAASLLLGMILGVAVAGFLGLNVFLAAGGVDGSVALDGRDGIILTGLVVGLGANPTHEVIKALKNRKERDAAAPGSTAGATSSMAEVAQPAAALMLWGGPPGETELPPQLSPAYLQTRNFRPTA